MKRLFLPLMLIASTPILAMYLSPSDLDYCNDTACNEREDTLLICAVKQGNAEAVKALLPLDSTQVDAQNKVGITALHIAAFRGDEKICKLLLSVGANPHNEKTYNGITPQWLAELNDQKHILQLFKTCQLVQPICLTKADKEARLANETALAQAVKKNDLTSVKCLLSQSTAELENKNSDGQTPLHLAAQNRNGEICKVLIAHGADVWANNNEGLNVFDVAAKAGITHTPFCRMIGLADDNMTLDDLRLKK